MPDTGMVVGQRRGRRRPVRRSRDAWIMPLIGVMALVLGSALIVWWGSGGAARTASSKASAAAEIGRPWPEPAETQPTPVFASFSGVRMHLPVPTAELTALAFHQASFSHAMPMASLVPIMDLRSAVRIATRKRAEKSGAASATIAASASDSPEATASTVPDGVWSGKAIQLWRSGRAGRPDTAADVGAPPGTAVLSPVNGTVIYVRTYKLYGKYTDYEVHIAPDGAPSADVVLIHISDVLVAPGDKVYGGVTRIASVRLLSKYTGLQLATYTADAGDHTHVQVNRLAMPGVIWVSTPAGPVATPIATATLDAAGSEQATLPLD
jgi:hypothetical protein